MVEMDEDVGAVWQTILCDDNEWLAQRIEEFQLTEESCRTVISSKPVSCRDRAFRTILKNRTFHGGILAAGSAPIKFGENGKGIKSRWYARTIAGRIRDIFTIRDRIQFVQGDGISVMRSHASKKKAAFFIDPPYTAAGKRAGNRLYTHHALDHEMLFTVAGTISGDFLMTYDNANDLVVMAAHHGFQTRTIAMKNTHHAVMDELTVWRPSMPIAQSLTECFGPGFILVSSRLRSVASSEPNPDGGLPTVSYRSASLENSNIRKVVCEILERRAGISRPRATLYAATHHTRRLSNQANRSNYSLPVLIEAIHHS